MRTIDLFMFMDLSGIEITSVSRSSKGRRRSESILLFKLALAAE